MSKATWTAFVGATLIALGAFLPVAQLPTIGPVVLMQSSPLNAGVLLAAAAAIVFIATRRDGRLVAAVGAPMLAISAWKMFGVAKLASDYRSTRAIEGSEFDRAIGETAATGMGVELGAWSIVCGSVIVCVSAWMARGERVVAERIARQGRIARSMAPVPMPESTPGEPARKPPVAVPRQRTLTPTLSQDRERGPDG